MDQAWDGVAPGQPRPAEQQGPSPAAAAVTALQPVAAGASSGSSSDVTRESEPVHRGSAESIIHQHSWPAAAEPALVRSAKPEPHGDADPAHLKPRGDLPAQPTPRTSSAHSAPRPAEAPKCESFSSEDELVPGLGRPSPRTEKSRRLSESREACEREAAEVEHVLSEGLKAHVEAASEELDQLTDSQQHRLVETTQLAEPKHAENPCTAAVADASTAMTSAPVEVVNQSSASSASLDVLDNSVCVAIDAEQFAAPDAEAISAEAALLNEQRHFARRDTFDPYEADAALR